MLEISDLTYRIAGRTLIEGASAFIAQGWKVGLVGRNGTGKSTLLRLILEDAPRGAGAIKLRRGAKLGHVAQEVPPGDETLLAVVLAADVERHALMTEAETATDPHRIADIHTRLADIDAYAGEARAASILVGLGFSQDDLVRPTREFSGGWRMRAALAGVLFAAPDVLLLDEPTNYLDLEGAAWLEDYLKDYPNTVIVVSHDREMLNRTVSHILALADFKLEVHPGGYDTYLRKRAERVANLVAMKAKQDAERAHLQAFVDRFKAKATKARQAQSRVKKLEKMQEIAIPIYERTMPFAFEHTDELPSPMLELIDADLGYVAGKPVLKGVNFRLDQDDRIVIIGPNGQGKTTLVKSIGARLALLAGKRRASKDLRVGYFSQEQLDELRAGETVLQHIRAMAPTLNDAKQRALAAGMGFGREKVETVVEKLSGGEKVRLLFGLMAMIKPHVLILDEPTSHLDIDSREALIHALNDYNGAVLLITHDVFLAEACADRLWLVHTGRANPYDGDLDDYRTLILNTERTRERTKVKAAADAPREKRANPAAARKRLADTEAALDKAQRVLAELDTALATPDLYTREPAKAADLSKRRAAAMAAVEKAEHDWLLASEAGS
ncbi:MAG: ABC-F family ATP-binding cassette domain-containing protein [Alphaproteobacteria bacterium]|nr:ABC-F family ATP-binding cassette domain-containing protein [Alphaproteobacteria bacterium]